MCILCVASRWSRRIVATLPWLLIPLIILWALSQLLPPAYRFEVTSPRLACLFVILISLGWYEILMPRLSVWRVRRMALMKERKRIEALEAAKWRKEATRRCRNCLTAYKEQNPLGGRFMCTYCGHISRRPVLDISNVVPDGCAQSAIGESGGKNIRLWDGKGCPSDWSSNSSWLGESFSGIANYWRRSLGCVLFCIGLVSGALGRGGSCSGDGTSNASRKAGSKKGEDGFGSQVNRGEKAKRRAEEKRLARLEREMLEEEERKQREEVARLVEERRRLRDEKLEAEKEAAAERERENRRDREAEKKRQEKVKEREKGWGKDKSHNDVEEAKKRNNKENERKSEFDKKGETDRRDAQKSAVEIGKTVENMRTYGETGLRLNGSIKGIGARQLDSAKASTNSPTKSSVAHMSYGSSFWGKSLRAASSFGIKSGKSRESPVGSTGLQSKQSTGSAWNRMAWTKVWGKDSAGTSKDVSRQPQSSVVDNTGNIQSGGLGGNSAIINGMDKNPGITLSRPFVGVDLQSASTTATTTIKSWHQLFSSSTDSSAKACATDVGDEEGQQHRAEPGNTSTSLEADSVNSSPARIYFGSSSPIALGFATSTSVLSNSVVVSVSAAESMSSQRILSSLGSEPVINSLAEETTKTEDSSYVEDPISLLGPVSESLDNFSLDCRGRHSSERGKSDVSSPESVPIPGPINRPGPIESPVSRLLPLATVDDNVGNQRPPITEPWGLPSLSLERPSCTSEQANWQMWKTPQLVNCEVASHLSSEWENNFAKPFSEESMQPSFNSENHIPSVFTQQTIAGQRVDPMSIGNSLWLNNPPFKPARDNWDEDAHHRAPVQDLTELGYNSVLSNGPSYEQPTNGFWSKSQAQDGKVENHWSVETSGTLSWSTTTKPLTRPHIGGIYATPDVQSVWSYK